MMNLKKSLKGTDGEDERDNGVLLGHCYNVLKSEDHCCSVGLINHRYINKLWSDGYITGTRT